jgi:hypothetical protein
MPRLGGAVDLPQVNDPASPAAGRQFLYFKSDGYLYSKAANGTVTQIGGSAGVSASAVDAQINAFMNGLRNEANPFPQYALSQVGELAYAENVTNTATVVTVGGTTDIAACVISVPISASPVYLSAAFTLSVTSVTAGQYNNYGVISIQEVANGVDSPIRETQAVPIPAAGVYSCNIVPFRLDANTVRVRTFKLQAGASSGAAFTTVNGVNNRSYIVAEAR